MSAFKLPPKGSPLSASGCVVLTPSHIPELLSSGDLLYCQRMEQQSPVTPAEAESPSSTAPATGSSSLGAAGSTAPTIDLASAFMPFSSTVSMEAAYTDFVTVPGVDPTVSSTAEAASQRPTVLDALSYLQMVKMMFHDRPALYTQLLEILKDFKAQMCDALALSTSGVRLLTPRNVDRIDIPSVIDRICVLFVDHTILIHGFNTFLPAGYRIDPTNGREGNPNAVLVTTPGDSYTTTLGHPI